MSTVPFECALPIGTVWQSVQTIVTRIVPATRCAWCAPTPRAVVAVFPLRSAGGAAASSTFVRVASPWQEVQDCGEHAGPPISRIPVLCVAGFTVVEV